MFFLLCFVFVAEVFHQCVEVDEILPSDHHVGKFVGNDEPSQRMFGKRCVGVLLVKQLHGFVYGSHSRCSHRYSPFYIILHGIVQVFLTTQVTLAIIQV